MHIKFLSLVYEILAIEVVTFAPNVLNVMSLKHVDINLFCVSLKVVSKLTTISVEALTIKGSLFGLKF